MVRVGGEPDDYDRFGETTRRDFLALLPPGFEWNGARILDFGAGAGRTLRKFTAEVEQGAEVWGCDIDRASVEWMQANLCPPFRVCHNDELPPLPFDNESFDLVYCMSVFTHLADSWSAWLLELHRVLKPRGILLATTMGPGAEHDLGEPWSEDRIGMLVTLPAHDWSRGGPVVFHSDWWIREHWGRAFDVIEHWPWGFGAGGPVGAAAGQGCVALRKRDVQLTVPDLERPADDRREWESLRHNLELVHSREAAWRERASSAEAQLHALTGRRSWRLAHLLAGLGRPFARRASRPPSPPRG